MFMRPVRSTLWRAFLACVSVFVFGAGCTSSPAPGTAGVPANTPEPELDPAYLVVGAADSVGSIPGSDGARFVYVFRQTDPASDRFSFQDRDLNFAFRPSPTALFFQIENRQGGPVWLEWDRSGFIDFFGSTRKLANAETRWEQRYATQPATQIPGQQRYTNYVFPIDLLVDPGGSTQQLHRPLFPEDKTAPQYVDKEFGVTLLFRFADRLQPYTFRFRVRSVLPR